MSQIFFNIAQLEVQYDRSLKLSYTSWYTLISQINLHFTLGGNEKDDALNSSYARRFGKEKNI